MFKRLSLGLTIFLLFTSYFVCAGDISTYVDLGFSPDGNKYMFAQYGVQADTLRPWAELLVIDVPANNYVSEGKKVYVHSSPVIAGHDGAGAFYTLLSTNTAFASKYRIDFLRQGQPMYLNLDEGEAPAGNSSITFRDFDKGYFYTAELVPYVEGSGSSLRSSFYISVEQVAKDGTVKKYIVGTPSVKRQGVGAYRIFKVIAAPENGAIIFIMEMWKPSSKGPDVRYMVEAFRYK